MAAKKQPTNDASTSATGPIRALSLFDCVCIIVGTIIGAGIFKTPASIAGVVPSASWMLVVWIAGGVIALVGALCFAELTTTYPDRGGDYGYLKRAFGKQAGFVFSWAAFWIIRPANIGVMTVVFGQFAVEVMPDTLPPIGYATAALLLMSAVNLLGLTAGKLTQNTLAVAKVSGIVLIVLAAFLVQPPAVESTSSDSGNSVETTSTIEDGSSGEEPSTAAPVDNAAETSSAASFHQWFWLAMVFVMFTFGGWNDIAFVASEVREPGRNLLRSLVLGVGTVVAVYVVFNVALLSGLGFERIGQYANAQGTMVNAPTALVTERLGQFSGRLVAALVCISCLGAISAMIFTSPRIYWATAVDYPQLEWLAGSHHGRGWWRSMVLQTLVTFGFVLVFGRGDNGFESIVAASAPYFWAFLALTVSALIVLRFRSAGQFSGYRVPLFPVLPLFFIACCLFMVYRSAEYMWVMGWHYEASAIAGLLVVGVVLSVLLTKLAGHDRETPGG